MLRGNVDIANLRQLSGWAQDCEQPDDPVSLLITDNGTLLRRVLANRHRDDLEKAGVGSGCHAFEIVFDDALSPLARHEISIQSELDGQDLPGSPVMLPPARELDSDVRDYLDGILAHLKSADEIAQAIAYLADATVTQVQRLAERESKSAVREGYRQFVRRWRQRRDGPEGRVPDAMNHHLRRALVIDDRVPKANRDAGSSAVIAHIQSLQRIGYEVTFVATSALDAAATETAGLDAIGVSTCRAPYYGSVEEVMLRQAGEFDVVYLHRISNAAKYGELTRHHFPKARLIYSVADLHHVRLARQAKIEDRPELIAQIRRMRRAELAAAALADTVITHSVFEAALLRKQVAGVNTHVVPWTLAPRPTAVPFAERYGVAFIGSFGHAPNVDAVRRLIGEIMPAVRARDPTIKCLLVGSDFPEDLRGLCGEGVEPAGPIDDLAQIFDRVRLTVAPLAYGAGIKGKVIDSLSAGVPCICSPIASEGLDLPPALKSCVGGDAAAIAALILGLHSDQAANAACRSAGLEFIAAQFSAGRVDDLMRAAIAPPRRRAGRDRASAHLE